MDHTPMHKERNPHLLRDTREILRDPANWTKQRMASHENGMDVDVHSPHAHSFCLLGAMCKAGGVESEWGLREVYRHEIDILAAEIEGMGYHRGLGRIWRFNDMSSTTHEKVLNVLNSALMRK